MGRGVFLSTFERQLDGKRRIVVPQDFRAAASSALFDGVVCFPSVECDCLEGGGVALFEQYKALIGELPFGDPLRSALEVSIFGGMNRLGFDSTGRVTLPEAICDSFGITDWVAVVGLGDRFQIWNREAFRAYRETQRLSAREGLAAFRNRQRDMMGTAAT